MPCRRQRSSALAPASCYFRIPMICSSVNLALRIVDLLAIDSTIRWRKFRGAGHRESFSRRKTFLPFTRRPGGLGRFVLGSQQQGINALRAFAFSAEAERHSSHTRTWGTRTQSNLVRDRRGRYSRFRPFEPFCIEGRSAHRGYELSFPPPTRTLTYVLLQQGSLRVVGAS